MKFIAGQLFVLLKINNKKMLTNSFEGVILLTYSKAKTKKAELHSFQRDGVWCEPLCHD